MEKTTKNSSISVFALCDVFYDAYYILGLNQFFKEKINFTLEGFPKFKQGTFAVIIKEENKETKIIIDSRDSSAILQEQLNWCDIYGKVNYNESEIVAPELISKIKPVGPSFGIKIWNFPQTVYFGSTNFLKARPAIENKRELIANYWRQYKRQRIENYTNKTASEDYIFFMGSIWKNESETNLYRSHFINACKKIKSLNFEGGFAPRNDHQTLGYDSLLTQQRYPFKEYMKKIKKSALVFNTPAVLSCHGWKLGEFLAMGKAIISTNHQNILPSPLVSEFHIEYVNPEISDIEKKIKQLLEDKTHRKFLEKNAKNYFDAHLAPQKVIENLYVQR